MILKTNKSLVEESCTTSKKMSHIGLLVSTNKEYMGIAKNMLATPVLSLLFWGIEMETRRVVRSGYEHAEFSSLVIRKENVS